MGAHGRAAGDGGRRTTAATSRLLLRRWREGDREAFAVMSADPEVMRRLGMTHDPADDFGHPRVPEGSHLRRHLLRRLTADQWTAGAAGDGGAESETPSRIS